MDSGVMLKVWTEKCSFWLIWKLIQSKSRYQNHSFFKISSLFMFIFTPSRPCSHIPTFSARHPMIPKLYVMPWKQDMKNQRLLKKAGTTEGHKHTCTMGCSVPFIVCVCVCFRTRIWQGSPWSLKRSLCVFVVGSVSATVRTPPLPPLLLSARRHWWLIARLTSPGKTPQGLMLRSGNIRHEPRNVSFSQFQLEEKRFVLRKWL